MVKTVFLWDVVRQKRIICRYNKGKTKWKCNNARVQGDDEMFDWLKRSKPGDEYYDDDFGDKFYVIRK